MAADHVRKIVSRVNTVTGKSYSEDPAIFSWQIANEPRCFSASPDTPVTVRDKYYRHVLAGANFWGWGGSAVQVDGRVNWLPGDDYCCDPAHEPQGFYSVYLSDKSTIELIKNIKEQLEML